MRRFVLALYLLIPMALTGQIVVDNPLSERLTGYDIEAVLDAETHIIKANMIAWWVNNSAQPVSDVRMHMYLNAFSSNKSSFNRNGRWSPAGEDGWGWVKIISLVDDDGNDLSGSMQFISPDDGNNDDRTVLQVIPIEPVQPADTLHLNIVFESKLPSPIVRTGYDGDFHFVAQWFPKFGVYETAGMRQREADGWNCHQFHPSSEFYSNHSVYNVRVTLPEEFVAGSGGLLIDDVDNGDGTRDVTWRAEDIVDFAWTAWPGYKVAQDKWRGVEITLMTTEQGLKKADNQFAAVKNALEYLDARVGPYPWPHLTFVDPPISGTGAGGMEYTTLFTSIGGGMIPSFYKLAEMVTIHEFGHAYFMGMLASNEFEEPWMDEGINSYWEQRIVDHYYGDGYGLIHLPFIKMSDFEDGRRNYISSQSRSVATNDLPSWMYPHGTYSMMSYSKASTWLHTLEGLIGTETMDDVFREYYRRWAFRHPSGRDFVAVVNDVVTTEQGDVFGENMDWFFDQVLYGNEICDYRLAGISSRKIRSYAGIVDGDSVTYTDSDRKNDTLYLCKIGVERVGGICLPVEVRIGFDDGSEVNETWDGKDRYRDFDFTGPHRAIWAKVDPDNKIDIDVDRLNNSWTEKPIREPARRMMNKFVFLMQMMISLITP